jgi:hypothetical protein
MITRMLHIRNCEIHRNAVILYKSNYLDLYLQHGCGDYFQENQKQIFVLPKLLYTVRIHVIEIYYRMRDFKIS